MDGYNVLSVSYMHGCADKNAGSGVSSSQAFGSHALADDVSLAATFCNSASSLLHDAHVPAWQWWFHVSLSDHQPTQQHLVLWQMYWSRYICWQQSMRMTCLLTQA